MREAALAGRVAQVEGEWLRARGDPEASRERLVQRVELLARRADRDVPPIWSARLDLAYTLVLLRDPQAHSALVLAAQSRPPQVPYHLAPGHGAALPQRPGGRSGSGDR